MIPNVAQYETSIPIPLAEIRNVIVDAWISAANALRIKENDENLQQAQYCYARMQLFSLILLAINEHPLVHSVLDDIARSEEAQTVLWSNSGTDPHPAKIQLAYATKIMVPVLLADCGLKSIAALLDDPGTKNVTKTSVTDSDLNPLDLNDLSKICNADGIDPAATRTLFVLLGNILLACAAPNGQLCAEIVEFWGNEDYNLITLYNKLIEPIAPNLISLERAADKTRQQIG